MSSLAANFPEVKCPGCPTKIVAAETDGGIGYPVERVRRGTGNVGLTPSLFGGTPLVVLRAGPTQWRAHRCNPRAFSVDNFTRKVKP